MDWRRQLQINQRRSIMVMATFVAIYLAVGLLFDLIIYAERYHYPFAVIARALVTGRLVPTATVIAGLAAVISITLTLVFHNRIMLAGTKYKRISPTNRGNSSAETKLHNILEELRIAAGLSYTPQLYLIDTDYMNAFASGYSEKSAAIAITRGLLDKLDRSELQAVVAHELSHIKHQDIKLTLVACGLTNLITIALDLLCRSLLIGHRHQKRGGQRQNRNGGDVLLLVVMILRLCLPIITIMLVFYLSRRREFMADAGAVELTRDNQSLAKALLKISQDHRTNRESYTAAYRQTPGETVRTSSYIFDPKQAGIATRYSLTDLFSTHPSIETRLAALGVTAKP